MRHIPAYILLLLMALSPRVALGDEEKKLSKTIRREIANPISIADRRVNRDTYLDAYANSHGVTPTKGNGRPDDDLLHHQIGTIQTDREAPPGDSYFGNYGGPVNSYGNQIGQYIPPKPAYLPPFKYGLPPVPNYGPPESYYGPPSNHYGPPNPPYGPIQPSYGVPYKIPSWFEKFQLKLDLFTIAKILLKLIIFKKIVKFIAIICLLLFIPTLAHKVDGGDDDGSNGGENNGNGTMARIIGDRGIISSQDRLAALSRFVEHAVAVYSSQQPQEMCKKRSKKDLSCRTRRVLDTVDKEWPTDRLLALYLQYYNSE